MDNARRTLLIVTGTLLSLGLVMVYSASFVFAEKKFGTPTYFLERHAVYMLAGCMALAITSLLDYHRLARYWKWYIAIAAILLIGVLVPGVAKKINGARRWYTLGPLTFQPSEAAKMLMILGLSGWIFSAREKIHTFKEGFLPGAAITGLIVVLIALEPDLGSAALLASVMGALLFVGGVQLRFAIPAILVALPVGAALAYTKFDHVRSRIFTFFSGDVDELGKGFQITQSLMAQGSGGIFGAGLGQGHSKLLYLPEAHNDFIFALIGEEFGLIGTWSVILLFCVLVLQGWRVASRAPDLLGSLIALGVTMCIGFQAAINIAVVTHSMPTKGISLPLVSYGGSSLIFALASIGLLLNVAAHPSCDAPPAALGAEPRRNSASWRLRPATVQPQP
ncbi:MAG TPA: putative lipid II flippase FtsW [Planctomycetota bacterium]|nr:putative lipid II flippase FtsW [Planctomycetota bacterium]